MTPGCQWKSAGDACLCIQFKTNDYDRLYSTIKSRLEKTRLLIYGYNGLAYWRNGKKLGLPQIPLRSMSMGGSSSTALLHIQDLCVLYVRCWEDKYVGKTILTIFRPEMSFLALTFKQNLKPSHGEIKRFHLRIPNLLIISDLCNLDLTMVRVVGWKFLCLVHLVNLFK